MPQAKTLSEKELKIVLATVAQGRHPARNRALVLTSFRAGLRAGELAALRVGDVVGSDGEIQTEIRLKAEQTKGQRGRVVMIGDVLKKELSNYVSSLKNTKPDAPFFYSQVSRSGMSANTVAQLFLELSARNHGEFCSVKRAFENPESVNATFVAQQMQRSPFRQKMDSHDTKKKMQLDKDVNGYRDDCFFPVC